MTTLFYIDDKLPNLYTMECLFYNDIISIPLIGSNVKELHSRAPRHHSERAKDQLIQFPSLGTVSSTLSSIAADHTTIHLGTIGN
jgi:hypothetical protein